MKAGVRWMMKAIAMVVSWRQLKSVLDWHADSQPAKHIYTYTQTNLLNTHLYLISSGNSLRQQSNIVVGMFLARIGSARLNVHAHTHNIFHLSYQQPLVLFLLFFSDCCCCFHYDCVHILLGWQRKRYTNTQKDWILCVWALTGWVISKLTKILFNDID